jgi:hypothetical protein
MITQIFLVCLQNVNKYEEDHKNGCKSQGKVKYMLVVWIGSYFIAWIKSDNQKNLTCPMLFLYDRGLDTHGDMTTFPTDLFRRQFDKELRKHIRPPTKKHVGRRQRVSKAIWTTFQVFQEQLAVQHGLPQEVSVVRGTEQLVVR